MRTITNEIAGTGLKFGLISFKGLNIGISNKVLADFKSVILSKLKDKYSDISGIKESAEYRYMKNVYNELGISFRKNIPSTIRLQEFVFKKGDIPNINTLVDTYNLISIDLNCCLGAHDTTKLSFPISLRTLEAGDRFIPFGSQTPKTIKSNEFGYVDANQNVICRLNVEQGAHSLVNPSSTEVTIVFEYIDSLHSYDIKQKFEYLAKYITMINGGDVTEMVF